MAVKTSFFAVRKRRLELTEPLGGQFFAQFWFGIRWWKSVAEQIGGSFGGWSAAGFLRQKASFGRHCAARELPMELCR